MKTAAKQFATIDEYLKSFPAEVRERLEKMRQTIRTAAPQPMEAISYAIPTFKLGGKNLVHFAGFKNHIGFYPVPSAVAAFREELAPYVRGKGSIQFPLDRPLPYELVKRIVAFRVKETRGG
jgi:uncharacterized protein YdhG (YjbR/CyaY superfamily)